MMTLLYRLAFMGLALLVILFAALNRHDIKLAISPFDRISEGGGVTIPLFLLVVLCFAAGFVAGHSAVGLHRLNARLNQWAARLKPSPDKISDEIPDEIGVAPLHDDTASGRKSGGVIE